MATHGQSGVGTAAGLLGRRRGQGFGELQKISHGTYSRLTRPSSRPPKGYLKTDFGLRLDGSKESESALPYGRGNGPDVKSQG